MNMNSIMMLPFDRYINKSLTTVDGIACFALEASSSDLTPLVCCLVQLMADKSFRTLHGFQELVEREWVALGYDFTDRLGLTTEAASPVCGLLLPSLLSM